MSETTIGSLIDGLNVKPRIDDGELVSSAVVLLCVIDADGDERISISWSDGLSWVTRTGMLHHALHEETSGNGSDDD